MYQRGGVIKCKLCDKAGVCIKQSCKTQTYRKLVGLWLAISLGLVQCFCYWLGRFCQRDYYHSVFIASGGSESYYQCNDLLIILLSLWMVSFLAWSNWKISLYFVWRERATVFAKPLQYVFNFIIKTAMFPRLLKSLKLAPECSIHYSKL